MAGVNRIVREQAKRSLFPSAQALIDSTISFNQGDLLVLDASTHKLRAQTTGDTGATFAGLAEVTIASGKLASPYSGTAVDAAQAISSIPGPVVGVVAKLVLKTSDAINPGDKVYPYVAGGAYHVTSVGTGLTAIGFYQGAAIASASAGQQIEVALVCPLAGAGF